MKTPEEIATEISNKFCSWYMGETNIGTLRMRIEEAIQEERDRAEKQKHLHWHWKDKAEWLEHRVTELEAELKSIGMGD